MPSANEHLSNGTCYFGKDNQTRGDFIPCGNIAFGDWPCCSLGDSCLGFETANACFDPDSQSHSRYQCRQELDRQSNLRIDLLTSFRYCSWECLHGRLYRPELCRQDLPAEARIWRPRMGGHDPVRHRSSVQRRYRLGRLQSHPRKCHGPIQTSKFELRSVLRDDSMGRYF